jgi:hypothetical protein
LAKIVATLEKMVADILRREQVCSSFHIQSNYPKFATVFEKKLAG